MTTTAFHVDQLIQTLDTRLFDAIRSETTPSDRESILLIQRCVRSQGPYAYLEIGSYLGGTLQPFYADERCSVIYSIDKRPDFVPDERGRMFFHYDRQVSSTDIMRENLSKAFPGVDAMKLRTFDCASHELDPDAIEHKPALCFIDAEHTNEAVFTDFQFCLGVCAEDAVIAFHDAGIVFEGLRMIRGDLTGRAIRHRGFKLGGSVYAIALNEAVDRYSRDLDAASIDEEGYFRESGRELEKMRSEFGRFGLGTFKRAATRSPHLFRILRSVKRFLSRPQKGKI